MRLPMLLIATLFAVTPGFAQQPSAPHPYGLDPYKPRDAALLRNYGATLVGLTPLLELHKLDPYVPSQAALLRQLGGAMPLWVGCCFNPLKTSGFSVRRGSSPSRYRIRFSTACVKNRS